MTYNEIDAKLSDAENAVTDYIKKYPSSARDLVNKVLIMAQAIVAAGVQAEGK